MAKDVLYIGIDLGTFRSVMVSSDSHEVEELTVIGTPKDPIARNFLKRDVLFGHEALKNRLALNLYRPLESTFHHAQYRFRNGFVRSWHRIAVRNR